MHYRRLSKMGVDNNFDDDWKDLVEKRIQDYSTVGYQLLLRILYRKEN